MKTPTVTAELIEYLEKIFPNKVPDIKALERSIWADVGAQMVIMHLKSLQNKQVRDALESRATLGS